MAVLKGPKYVSVLKKYFGSKKHVHWQTKDIYLTYYVFAGVSVF